MANDYSKLIDHPEKQEIITKLTSGESPKVVSNYLKDKYSKPNEDHLRIPATVLEGFLDEYAGHHNYVKKIVKGTTDSKLEKNIADSLLDNSSWKDRLSKSVETEINYLEKLDNVLTILEIRAEQVFDMIQSDPDGTRADYVFTKYMELLMMAIEKGDKIRNDRPDIKIEHTYTVQMVEQQSAAFQEAIRRVLERLGPDYSTLFMDLLGEEMSKITPSSIDDSYGQSTPKQIQAERKVIDKLDSKVQEFDKEIETEVGDGE